MANRIGRPTDNPKIEKVTVRLDAESLQILEKYCKQESIGKAEALRRGVIKLKDDLNKK